MPEFGDYGQRTPEEIEYLERASEAIASRHTVSQLDGLLRLRGAELEEGADDRDTRRIRLVNDARYEAAVKEEYDAMLLAVEAVAKYSMARDRTIEVRRNVEDEVCDLLAAANRIARSGDLSPEDFTPDA